MRTEGVKYAVPPLVYQCLTALTSQRQTTLFAISGEPVLPYCYFRKATPGGISAGFPGCLAPTGSSLEGNGSLTCSHQGVIGILTKRSGFVKRICSITSSLASGLEDWCNASLRICSFYND